MISLLVKFALGFKKNIPQLLLVFGVLYGLYWYYEDSQQALDTATEKAEVLEGDNKKLVHEVKDLKDQTKIDILTVSTHSKDQGDLDVEHAVAMEKVQHEVNEVLQGVPVENRDSKSTVDSVSRVVIDGMWNSYRSATHGGTVSKSSR